MGEIVLVFHKDKNYEKVMDQLSKELNDNPNVNMVVMTKADWIQYERELIDSTIKEPSTIFERHESKLYLRPYKRVTAKNRAPIYTEQGFNSLDCNGIPVVPMPEDDNNIISARLYAEPLA